LHKIAYRKQLATCKTTSKLPQRQEMVAHHFLRLFAPGETSPLTLWPWPSGWHPWRRMHYST